jgi:hypothetical protein
MKNLARKAAVSVLLLLTAVGMVRHCQRAETDDDGLAATRSRQADANQQTDAFTASKTPEAWVVELKREHFSDKAASVAVTFNGTFYGIFLFKDSIRLPVLGTPAKVVLAPLDRKGRPMAGVEAYELEAE